MRKFTQVHRLAGTVALAGALFTATPAARAEHEIMTPASDAVKVTWYGQVNRLMLWADDGNETVFAHADNDNSSTRIGIKARGKVSDSLGVGAKFEVENQSNASNKMSQEKFRGEGNVFKLRHADVYLFGNWGKLSLGQGDLASNGTAEADLSGTSVIGYSGVADLNGGMYFYDNNIGGIGMMNADGEMEYNPTINDVMLNLDGIGRDDRLRYDTPAMAGFTLAASTAQEDAWDIALRYANKYESGWKVKAALAYVDAKKIQDYDSLVVGSVSVMAPMGINLTFASATAQLPSEAAGDDPMFWYGKLGYQARLTDLGKTSFSVDFGQYNDFDVQGDEAQTWGVQVVQKVKVLSSEFYAGYRSHMLDRPGHDFEDINTFGTGVRMKF